MLSIEERGCSTAVAWQVGPQTQIIVNMQIIKYFELEAVCINGLKRDLTDFGQLTRYAATCVKAAAVTNDLNQNVVKRSK